LVKIEKLKQAKILHICSAEKFIPAFIEFIRINFNWEQHSFIIWGGDIVNHTIRLDDSIVQLKSRKQLFAVSSAMHQADKIIMHGLFNHNLIFLALQPWLLKKCYWFIWGGDLYCHKLRVRNFRSDVQETIRAFVIKRIGHFVTYIKGDYELAQKWYGVKGKYYKCLMYPSNLYKEYEVPPKQGETVNILVGNSADPTNYHAEVFEKLRLYKDDNIQIYCPLSYGQADYAEGIVKLGTELFGSKFTPLLDFMPFEKYLELLGQIDIAVFAHERQQAMGNTITLLGLGKKVFTRKDVTPWFLFNGLGVKVFDVSEFELFSMGEDVQKRNQQCIKTHFSEPKLVEQLHDIFD
jgi:dTDP-N-acetylfucosamine:lipid II N-acetylfucosaminyltransferase